MQKNQTGKIEVSYNIDDINRVKAEAHREGMLKGILYTGVVGVVSVFFAYNFGRLSEMRANLQSLLENPIKPVTTKAEPTKESIVQVLTPEILKPSETTVPAEVVEPLPTAEVYKGDFYYINKGKITYQNKEGVIVTVPDPKLPDYLFNYNQITTKVLNENGIDYIIVYGNNEVIGRFDPIKGEWEAKTNIEKELDGLTIFPIYSGNITPENITTLDEFLTFKGTIVTYGDQISIRSTRLNLNELNTNPVFNFSNLNSDTDLTNINLDGINVRTLKPIVQKADTTTITDEEGRSIEDNPLISPLIGEAFGIKDLTVVAQAFISYEQINSTNGSFGIAVEGSVLPIKFIYKEGAFNILINDRNCIVLPYKVFEEALAEAKSGGKVLDQNTESLILDSWEMVTRMGNVLNKDGQLVNYYYSVILNENPLMVRVIRDEDKGGIYIQFGTTDGRVLIVTSE